MRTVKGFTLGTGGIYPTTVLSGMAVSKGSRGFTLLEMLVVLAVVGIVAVIAVPSLQTMIASNALRSTEQELISTLNTARMQALSMRSDIVVTPASGGWSKGWSIDYPASYAEESKTFVPRNSVAVAREVGSGAVTFQGRGGVSGGALSFSVCHSSLDRGRTLQLSFLGKVSSTIKGDCS